MQSYKKSGAEPDRDSCNDLPMFARAGHGVLVGNADPQARRPWAHCLEQPYCHGIVSVLRQLA